MSIEDATPVTEGAWSDAAGRVPAPRGPWADGPAAGDGGSEPTDAITEATSFGDGGSSAGAGIWMDDSATGDGVAAGDSGSMVVDGSVVIDGSVVVGGAASMDGAAAAKAAAIDRAKVIDGSVVVGDAASMDGVAAERAAAIGGAADAAGLRDAGHEALQDDLARRDGESGSDVGWRSPSGDSGGRSWSGWQTPAARSPWSAYGDDARMGSTDALDGPTGELPLVTPSAGGSMPPASPTYPASSQLDAFTRPTGEFPAIPDQSRRHLAPPDHSPMPAAPPDHSPTWSYTEMPDAPGRPAGFPGSPDQPSAYPGVPDRPAGFSQSSGRSPAYTGAPGQPVGFSGSPGRPPAYLGGADQPAGFTGSPGQPPAYIGAPGQPGGFTGSPGQPPAYTGPPGQAGGFSGSTGQSTGQVPAYTGAPGQSVGYPGTGGRPAYPAGYQGSYPSLPPVSAGAPPDSPWPESLAVPLAPRRQRTGRARRVVTVCVLVLLVLVAGGQAYELKRLNDRLDRADRAGATARARADAQIGLLNTRANVLESTVDAQLDPVSVAAQIAPSVYELDAGDYLGTAWAVRNSSGGTDLITNYHVVAPVYKLGKRAVDLVRGSQRLHATVVKVSAADDVALVHVSQSLPVLDVEKAVVPGEAVLVEGTPLGWQASVTTGVVSNVERRVRTETGFIVYFQFDAAINPGNSGGPVVDARGRVLGVASAVFIDTENDVPAQSMSLAIPVTTACRVLAAC